jgi:hypothetical protein
VDFSGFGGGGCDGHDFPLHKIFHHFHGVLHTSQKTLRGVAMVANYASDLSGVVTMVLASKRKSYIGESVAADLAMLRPRVGHILRFRALVLP